jgi:hypothetical protein
MAMFYSSYWSWCRNDVKLIMTLKQYIEELQRLPEKYLELPVCSFDSEYDQYDEIQPGRAEIWQGVYNSLERQPVDKEGRAPYIKQKGEFTIIG